MMEENRCDVIEKSGLTGKDFADASMLLMRSINSKGHDRPADEDKESWEQMERYCMAGAMLGSEKCMANLAEIVYGLKTERARKMEDAFGEAVKLWEQAMEMGDGKSATNLGLLHLHKPIPGAGKFGELEYDEEKALELFKKGYEFGDMKAGRHIGLAYKEGRGTKKDAAKAFEWFSIAAQRGDSSAKLFMADAILTGDGTDQNVEDAIERYKALVECKGHDVTTGAFALANIYRDGIYAEKDLEKSREYFESVIRTATPIEKHLKEAAQAAIKEME